MATSETRWSRWGEPAGRTAGPAPIRGTDTENSPPRLFVPLTSARLALPLVLGPCIVNRLPLEVGNGVGSAASERYNVIFPKTRTRAAGSPGRRAGLLPLELPRYLAR